jgi:hypothetical protein
MNSYELQELEIDEQSFVGATYMARVANEIRRAAGIEKASRKITQQAIADKIGTTRAVVNREMSGLENLGARRTAELLWALGWEPYFEARKIPASENHFYPELSTTSAPSSIRGYVTTTAKETELAPLPPPGQFKVNPAARVG